MDSPSSLALVVCPCPYSCSYLYLYSYSWQDGVLPVAVSSSSPTAAVAEMPDIGDYLTAAASVDSFALESVIRLLKT